MSWTLQSLPPELRASPCSSSDYLWISSHLRTTRVPFFMLLRCEVVGIRSGFRWKKNYLDFEEGTNTADVQEKNLFSRHFVSLVIRHSSCWRPHDAAHPAAVRQFDYLPHPFAGDFASCQKPHALRRRVQFRAGLDTCSFLYGEDREPWLGDVLESSTKFSLFRSVITVTAPSEVLSFSATTSVTMKWCDRTVRIRITEWTR